MANQHITNIKNLKRIGKTYSFSLPQTQKPLVSIIIPAFNAEKYLINSTLSAVNQTYKNVEIIIVDNNSADKTAEIAQKLSSIYKKIRLYKERKKGAGAARNRGVKEARGEYLMFLDADDILLPYAVELQVATALKTGSEMVYGDFGIFKNHKCIEIRKMIDVSNKSLPEKLLIQFQGNAFPIGSVLLSKRKFEEVGGFDTDLSQAEDFDLWNRLILSGVKISKSPFPIYLYRLHPDQTTKNFERLSKDADKALMKLWNSINSKLPHLIKEEFLVNVIKGCLTRYENIPEVTAELIRKLERLAGSKEQVKLFKKLYLRRYSRKV